MNTWLRPVGSRAPAVYWRRRGIVGLAVVAIVAGIVSLVALWPRPPAPEQAVPAPPASPTVVPAPQQVFGDCNPAAIEVGVSGAATASRTRPQTFKVTFTNAGPDACNLIVTGDTFELRVTSGSDRIFRTGHCRDWGIAGVVTLEPGKAQSWPLTWPVKRSADGCKLRTETLGGGTYVGTATFGQQTGRHVFLVRA